MKKSKPKPLIGSFIALNKHMSRPCPRCTSSSVRFGHFIRKSDSKIVQRYQCKSCKMHFSDATFSQCFNQKKRRINSLLYQLLGSAVSMRRAARILNVHHITIARRKKFLSQISKERKEKTEFKRLSYIQFDELETSEHTKCKPVSIIIGVEPESRKILDFQVARFPAKGKLAKFARKKYGPRVDERPKARREFLRKISKMVTNPVEVLSDKNPHYPKDVKEYLPGSIHFTTKGRRGCVVGQGELKRGGFDPLFSLNHTCAMLRANMNRLLRRTWCTSKTIQGLIDHLNIYVDYHNRVLTTPK